MKLRPGVSSVVFAGTTVALLVISGVGFSLYLTAPRASAGMTETTTSTEVMTSTVTSTSMANSFEAVQFTPAPGQMVHDAWLFVEPTGGGEYAVSVYAQGLESTQGSGNVYIVEGTQSSGMMATSPLGVNASASEFETTSGGVGSYFVQLTHNPYGSYESIQIVFLRGMQMSNATVVAFATLTMP